MTGTAKVITCPRRVLKQETFDFGVHRQGKLLPEPRGFRRREGDRLRLQIDVAPSEAHRIPEPQSGKRREQDDPPPIVRRRGFQQPGNLLGCENLLLRFGFVRREVVDRGSGIYREVSHPYGCPESRGDNP